MAKTAKKMSPNVTHLQERFCQEYAVSGVGATAAKQAGYAASRARKTASRLLTLPHIAQRIREIRTEQGSGVTVTAQMVVEGLHREATDFGLESRQSARVAAWTALGRTLGMFVDKSEVKMTGTVRVMPPTRPPASKKGDEKGRDEA